MLDILLVSKIARRGQCKETDSRTKCQSLGWGWQEKAQTNKEMRHETNSGKPIPYCSVG